LIPPSRVVHGRRPGTTHEFRHTMAQTIHMASKLPNAGITIFTQMTNLANQHGAINLSQGFPDFEVPEALVALVEQNIRAGHNQYAPMQGVLALREKIAEKVESLYGHRYDPVSEITVSHGATEALFAAITATVHPGDEVILFEPAYDSYAPAIELSGGIPVYLKLRHPRYRIDWDEVQDAVSSKTRLMIFNSPHNPTGAVLSEADLDALEGLAERSGFLIVSDEVYEHIVFDGLRHESMARRPALVERSFVISSFGKTYHTTGWKIGYCLAPEPLTREFQKIHQFLTFACNTPIQMAYAEFLNRREAYTLLWQFYQEKRDRFLSLIADSRFGIIPCRGTYFQLLGYHTISDAPDTEFARELTTAHGVAAIPPSVFYSGGDDHKVLRFCFAKKDNTLTEAAERLCRI